MRRFTYSQADGLDTVLSSDGDSDFFITKVDGIEEPEAGIQTQKTPFQPGERLVDSRLPPRDIVMEGLIKVKDLISQAALRRSLIQGLNGYIQTIGSMLFEYSGGSKKLNCIVEQGPILPNKIATVAYQPFSVVFRAYDPYWYDLTSQSVLLQTLTKKFHFTWWWKSAGRPYGLYNTDPAMIQNDGDVATPPMFTLYGPSTSPKITNQTTGEFFKINYTLGSGDVMTVTTGFGNKNCSILTAAGSTISGMPYIAAGSTFWQLSTGENDILLTDDTALITAQVLITWTNRYVGV